MPNKADAPRNLRVEDDTLAAVRAELEHERKVQSARWSYVYHVSGTVGVSPNTQQFSIQIEQGTDFHCRFMLGSAFSYDADAGDATDFPIPNSLGVTTWAGRGLSVQITDTRAGRSLTDGFIPFEILFSPGYGINYQSPLRFKYHFYENSRVRFDVRNNDTPAGSTREHDFNISLLGYKIIV